MSYSGGKVTHFGTACMFDGKALGWFPGPLLISRPVPEAVMYVGRTEDSRGVGKVG